VTGQHVGDRFNQEKENQMSKGSTSGLTRVLTVIIAIGGLVMLVLGITMYAVASGELGRQNITVASVDEGSNGVENGPNAGKPVQGPFTALSQIQAITHHLQQSSQVATGGTKDATTGVVTGGDPNVTYGTAPSLSLDAQGNCGSTTAQWTDPAGNGTIQCTKGAPPEVTGSINAASMASLRSTMTTGSFLISSLFVSVLAFGVSALIIGLGILFLIVSVVAWTNIVRAGAGGANGKPGRSSAAVA